MLKVSYRLRDHGWATACLFNGSETLTLSVSYITPALDDLIDAIIVLLLGYERADFRWLTEPGDYHIRLVRHGEVIRLTVLERSQEVFSGEERLLPLAVQVRSQLRQLRHTHGLLGYQTSWRRPFPIEASKRLETLIKEAKAKLPSP